MLITDEKIRAKLECVSADLPSVPEIILRVKEISENPQSSAADLANIILSDHHLTTRILKLANSAYYAEFSGKIATVTQAIVLMGFRTVRNVVMSIAIHDAFTNSSRINNFNFNRFWTKSLGCGVIAKLLARACHYKVPEEAFIAGFIHDIGKVILNQIFKVEYPKIEKLIETGEDDILTERGLVGIDHCVLGVWLGRKWNLPIHILAPILYHHRTGDSHSKKSKSILVDIIYIAQKCSNGINKGENRFENSEELLKEAKVLLGISKEIMKEITSTSWDTIQEISSDLGIELEQREGQHTIPSEENGQKPTPTSSSVTNEMETPPGLIEEMQHITDKLTRRERELSIIQEASESIRAATTTEEILQTLLESIFRGFEMGRIVLFDLITDESKAQGRIGFGVRSQEQVRNMAVEIGQSHGVLCNVWKNRRMYNILDVTSQIYTSIVSQDELKVIGAKAFAALPIEIEGDVEMVIVINNKDQEIPIEDDQLKSIQSLLAQAEMALEKIRLKNKLEKAL